MAEFGSKLVNKFEESPRGTTAFIKINEAHTEVKKE
jgi:hypothetical protein